MKQNICLGVTALLLVGGLLLPPRTEAATISNETLTNAIEKVLQESSPGYCPTRFQFAEKT